MNLLGLQADVFVFSSSLTYSFLHSFSSFHAFSLLISFPPLLSPFFLPSLPPFFSFSLPSSLHPSFHSFLLSFLSTFLPSLFPFFLLSLISDCYRPGFFFKSNEVRAVNKVEKTLPSWSFYFSGEDRENNSKHIDK